jgi:hypothetical protein
MKHIAESNRRYNLWVCLIGKFGRDGGQCFEARTKLKWRGKA